MSDVVESVDGFVVITIKKDLKKFVTFFKP